MALDTEVKFKDGIILYKEQNFGKYVNIDDYLLIEDIRYRIKANKLFDITNNKWIITVEGYGPKGVMKNNDKTPADVIQAIITSYNYNRTEGHLLKVIKNVITRLEHEGPAVYEDVGDDADIFNGILVVLYGYYGTSPRYGWLENEYKDVVLKALKDELESELSDIKNHIEMEPDEYSEDELYELRSLIKQLEY